MSYTQFNKVTRLFRSPISKLASSTWIQSFGWGLGLTLIFLWPVLNHFSTHLPSREDGVLISYLMNWSIQSVKTGQNLYQVPFFYPFHNTLAYSDPFFMAGLTTWPVRLFSTNLVVLSNTALVVGTIASVMGMYLLVWEMTRSKTASLLSALVFTFSSLHFHYVVHLHMYLVAGIPFSLYCFLRWLRTHQLRYVIGAGGWFLYQTLNAPETGFFLVFSYLPLLGQTEIRRQLIKYWRTVVASLVVVGVICGAFYYPYFKVSAEFNYTRSIRDAAAFGHSLNFLVQPEFLIIGGLILMGWYVSRQSGNRQLTNQTLITFKPLTLLVITLVGALFMLGPVVKVSDQTFKIFGLPIPLPYAIAYYLVPGFQAFRASSRWMIVFDLGLALLLGTYWAQIRRSQATQWLLIIGLGVWLWLSQVPHLPLFAVPDTIDPIYSVVKNRPEQVLVEVPVMAWNMQPYNVVENDRLWRQIYHGKTLHNGSSGFTPPQREREWLWLWELFPEPETIKYFKDEGVELMVVDFGLYQEMQAHGFNVGTFPTPDVEVLRARLANLPQLELVSCTQAACLYTIK